MLPCLPSTTLPVNKAAQLANSIIKGIEAALEPAIEAALIAAVPALGLPVVKQVVGEIEKIIEDKITVYLETGADFVIIDMQTNAENSNLAAARAAYIRALHTNDPAQIAAARKAYDVAQSALANDDGSGTL